MSVRVTEGRFKGMVRQFGRIIIPKPIRDDLSIIDGTYYEGQVYGKNKDKILLTFIK